MKPTAAYLPLLVILFVTAGGCPATIAQSPADDGVCKVHADCEQGEICSTEQGAPQCTPAARELLCEQPSQCTAPQHCNSNGVCADPTEQVGCESRADCGTGQTCSVAGACQPVAPGASCTADSDCDAALQCRNHTCKPAQSGCISDHLPAPIDQGRCSCSYVDCDGTEISCSCPTDCYTPDPAQRPEGCAVACDSSGQNCSVDADLGACQNVSCVPKTDLSDEEACALSDCVVEPNQIQIDPVVEVAPAAIDLQREVSEVGVLFVIDNSHSMFNDQMAAACALESFFTAAGQNGASYKTGVLTTDMLGEQPGLDATYDYDGDYVAPPQLVGIDGSCSAVLECACGDAQPDLSDNDVCDFNNDGDWYPSDDPASEQQLVQSIVQGDKGSRYEGGLEQTFQFFAEMERQGTFPYGQRFEVVVVSDEEADGDGFLCPFDAVERNPGTIPNFNPPPASGSCHQDLIAFYNAYFTSRGIIVNGLLQGDTCSDAGQAEPSVIYRAVVAATGGHWGSICECESFDDFFTDVGTDASTLSTELCLGDQQLDLATTELTYTEAGQTQPVPKSPTDGWSYDATTNCIVLHGSWADKFGAYQVTASNLTTTGSASLACLPDDIDPLAATITVTCAGVTVPKDNSHGWSFNPATHCIAFHGTWGTVKGPCTVDYI